MTDHANPGPSPTTEAYTVEVSFSYRDDSEAGRRRARAAADRIARVAARLAHAIDPEVAIVVRGSTGDLLAGKAVYLPDDHTREPANQRPDRDRDRGGSGRDSLGGRR